MSPEEPQQTDISRASALEAQGPHISLGPPVGPLWSLTRLRPVNQGQGLHISKHWQGTLPTEGPSPQPLPQPACCLPPAALATPLVCAYLVSFGAWRATWVPLRAETGWVSQGPPITVRSTLALSPSLAPWDPAPPPHPGREGEGSLRGKRQEEQGVLTGVPGSPMPGGPGRPGGPGSPASPSGPTKPGSP